MSLIVTSSGNDFEIHEAGAFPMRCTRIIDLGTHDTLFQGQAKKQHTIAIGFESSVLMGDDAGDWAGKPFLITQQYTASLSDKANLRKVLESWRGRKFTQPELDGFDLKAVLGKAGLVNVVHSDPKPGKKVYANISTIMPLPAGLTAPPAVGEQLFFSLSAFDAEVYEKLSDYYKKTIADSDEYKVMFGKTSQGKAPAAQKKPAATDIDDDIPF